MILDLSLDSLDSSIHMAEKIMKRNNARKNGKKGAATPTATNRNKPKKKRSSSSSTNQPRPKLATAATTSQQQARRKAERKSSVNTSTTTVSAGSKSTAPAATIPVPAPDDDSVVSAISDIGSEEEEELPAANAKSEMSSKNSNKDATTPVFAQSLIVDKQWEQIKAMPEYEDLWGEQIVLSFMELDPSARNDLGITSLRSSRFDEVCQTLLVIVDLVVSLVGPEMDEFDEELVQMGRQCQAEGIKVGLLGGAVSKAVALVLGEDRVTEQDLMAWKVVVDFVAQKMLPR